MTGSSNKPLPSLPLFLASSSSSHDGDCKWIAYMSSICTMELPLPSATAAASAWFQAFQNTLRNAQCALIFKFWTSMNIHFVSKYGGNLFDFEMLLPELLAIVFFQFLVLRLHCFTVQDSSILSRQMEGMPVQRRWAVEGSKSRGFIIWRSYYTVPATWHTPLIISSITLAAAATMQKKITESYNIAKKTLFKNKETYL